MALSGVNQSHVQPVWAEIPSLRENFSEGARLYAATFAFAIDAVLKNRNPLVNFRVPNEDTEEEESIFSQAALIVKAVLSFR